MPKLGGRSRRLGQRSRFVPKPTGELVAPSGLAAPTPMPKPSSLGQPEPLGRPEPLGASTAQKGAPLAITGIAEAELVKPQAELTKPQAKRAKPTALAAVTAVVGKLVGLEPEPQATEPTEAPTGLPY